jgi:hypothetical protein
MPVTIPLKKPTVAIDVVDELQKPPATSAESVCVLPVHALAIPEMVIGLTDTVTVAAVPHSTAVTV